MLKEMELSSAPLRFTPAKRKAASRKQSKNVGLRQKGSLVAELGAVTRNYVSRKFYHFVLYSSSEYSPQPPVPRRKRILRQGSGVGKILKSAANFNISEIFFHEYVSLGARCWLERAGVFLAWIFLRRVSLISFPVGRGENDFEGRFELVEIAGCVVASGFSSLIFHPFCNYTLATANLIC